MRYLHPGSACIASFYAPIVFTPCPVLMFEHDKTYEANDSKTLSNSTTQSQEIDGGDNANMMQEDDTTGEI